MRTSSATFAVLLGITLAAAPAGAQVSLQAGGLYATLTGDDFDGIDAGLGLEGHVRFAVGTSFSLGGGIQYTSHGIDGFSEKFGVTGFFVEPRYSFRTVSPTYAPYAAGRGTYVRYKVESGGSTLEATGSAFALGGGVLIKVAPAIQLDLGVLYFFTVSFGDAELDDVQQPGTDSSGSSFALRAGLAFGLGGR